MPLLQDQDTFTMRIQLGEVEIRRVYLGEDLMWGLYSVTYHLAGGTQGAEPVTEYVWGVAKLDLPVPTWAGQQYYTKFNGWYEGNTYVTAVPAIELNFQKDLELYAKWTQRKYRYSGQYMWTTQVWVDGEGGDEEESTASGATFSAITNTSPRYREEGQCTQWCYSRSKAAFGTPCLTGYSNAKDWINTDGGTLGSGWKRVPGGSPQPGDVVVFGPSSDNKYGHVLFQETNSIITQSNVRWPGGGWDTWWIDNGYKEWNSQKQRWEPLHELFSCVSAGKPSTYLGGSRLGVLRYTGSGGGGGGGGGEGHYETQYHYGNMPETDCPQQKPPSMPSPPQGSWTSQQQYTYTRNYHYDSNSWQEDWQLASNNWDTSGDGWL